jgi:hypothetical protein
MTTQPSTLIKPLVFQENRGPLSQDSLYHDMGFDFILAPNRYRKLAGSTPREMPESDLRAIVGEQIVEEVLAQDPQATWEDVLEAADQPREVAAPTFSAGMRLLFLNLEDQRRVQQEAVRMMAEDWPDHAHLIYGYEPHINLFDEILIWRRPD